MGTTTTFSSPNMPHDSSEGMGSHRLVATGVAEEVRADTVRSAFPALSTELLASFERRARAQDAAATLLPVDSEQWLSDRWALETIARREQRLRQAESRVEDKRMTLDAAYDAQAAVPASWNWAMRLFLAVVMLGGTLLSVYPLAGLLAPALDAYVLRSVLASVFEDEVAQLSFREAQFLSWGAAGALLFWQSATVLITWGRVGRGMMAFFLAETVFSLAFGLVRLGPESTNQSFAMSAFEIATVGLFGAALTIISRRLAHDAEMAGPYRLAQAAVETATLAYREALADYERLDRELEHEKDKIARREEALRRHPACQELMAATAVTEHLVTLSQLISERVPSELSEGLFAELPEQLRQVYGLGRGVR